MLYAYMYAYMYGLDERPYDFSSGLQAYFAPSTVQNVRNGEIEKVSAKLWRLTCRVYCVEAVRVHESVIHDLLHTLLGHQARRSLRACTQMLWCSCPLSLAGWVGMCTEQEDHHFECEDSDWEFK